MFGYEPLNAHRAWLAAAASFRSHSASNHQLYRCAFTFFIVQQILPPQSLIIQKYALSKIAFRDL
jgi:hypothetical protein